VFLVSLAAKLNRGLAKCSCCWSHIVGQDIKFYIPLFDLPPTPSKPVFD
jgi:hypothetical protein